ncbi:hypothetical protein RRG08_026126 [Elysia crispata]|uniref:Uncharacterized protein n=1 Tax=Elysia crispata TaxID=231223 RepID=A0AAE1ASS8_9GAST|nr:hypothetical protein RRG08_026126 [Elysia crispata]
MDSTRKISYQTSSVQSFLTRGGADCGMQMNHLYHSHQSRPFCAPATTFFNSKREKCCLFDVRQTSSGDVYNCPITNDTKLSKKLDFSGHRIYDLELLSLEPQGYTSGAIIPGKAGHLSYLCIPLQTGAQCRAMVAPLSWLHFTPLGNHPASKPETYFRNVYQGFISLAPCVPH